MTRVRASGASIPVIKGWRASPMPSKKLTTPPHLQWANPTKLPDSTMLLALTGWMDGGSVSTGTVRQLMADRDLVAPMPA